MNYSCSIHNARLQDHTLFSWLYQPNAIREKLACKTIEACRIMETLRDAKFRGKVIYFPKEVWAFIDIAAGVFLLTTIKVVQEKHN